MTDGRRPFDVLFRHFFGGFLDNDLLSPATDLHGPLSKAVAALAILGMLYPFKLLGTYGRPFWDYAVLDEVSWADKSGFVTISLVVMGLLTVLEWDALRLDRRDSRALGTLPLRSRTIVWAKFAALGKFLLVLSVPLTLLGTLTFPVIMHAGWRSGVLLAARTMAGHAVATLAASWFAFFSLLAVQSLLQCAPGRRVARRLAAGVQLLATLGLVVALLMLPFIASSTATLKLDADGISGLAPQMWFVGIYQMTAGQGDADWALLASRGWLALVVSAGAGVGASLVAFRRAMGTTLEAVQGGGGGPSLTIHVTDLVSRLVARHPAERGFFAFAILTILRSPLHRVVLAVFFGVALALSMVTMDFATLGWQGTDASPMQEPHALAMQWVVLTIVLAGVRVAASAPAELQANWVLRLLEADRPARWMAGFRKAVLVIVVVPVIVLLACAMTAQYGWHTAWTQALTSFVFAGAAFELLFLGFGRVPFACPIPSEAGEFRIRGPVMIALFTILVVPVAGVVAFGLRSAAGTVIVLAAGVAVIAALRWRGNLAIARGGGLAFEPEYQGTQALGIQP